MRFPSATDIFLSFPPLFFFRPFVVGGCGFRVWKEIIESRLMHSYLPLWLNSDFGFPKILQQKYLNGHVCPTFPCRLFLSLSPVSKVDNLCRNPPLVVLVPASQEAEPLDITVTLHPRAAQALPHSKAPIPVPLPLSRPLPLPRCVDEKGSEVYGSGCGSPPNQSASPGRPLEPPSPSSLGINSAASSPSSRGQQGGRPGSAACEGTGSNAIASPGAGEGRGGNDPSDARQQVARAGFQIVEGEGEGEVVKRRGGLKIPGGKVRVSRGGSVTPAKTPAPAPASVARHFASCDGSRDVGSAASVSPRPGRPSLTITPGDKGREGEATASPTGERRGKTGVLGSTPTSRDGEDGTGGGGIFASLSRRRSGDAAAGRFGGDRLGTKPRNVPAVMSAREKGASDKGRKTRVVRGGLSSAPDDTQASYKMFFGDTDDGGEETGSSDDDEDGAPPRKSFIRVSCTARTSYKLFSSDPQVPCSCTFVGISCVPNSELELAT